MSSFARPIRAVTGAALVMTALSAGPLSAQTAQDLLTEGFLQAVTDQLRREAQNRGNGEAGGGQGDLRALEQELANPETWEQGPAPQEQITTQPLDGDGAAQPRDGFSVEALESLLAPDGSDGAVVIPPAEAPVTDAAMPPADAPAGLDRAPTVDEIMAATYTGGPLPRGHSALTVKVQVLLDRAGTSPGVIDGIKGGMSESAILAFETRHGLPQDGVMDPEVWRLLGGETANDVLTNHVIAPVDVAMLSPGLPNDYAELATLDWLGYERVTEALAERFHMDENFLKALNPGSSFTEGETITVARAGPDIQGRVSRIEVRKSVGRLAAFDDTGHMVANYPVTVGSSDTPSPSGSVVVEAVAYDPTYHYSPDNFVQGENLQPLTLPPGPNGPVGSIWIDLSRPSYGLHGTPNPATLFRNQSHGCVRLTNWDARELAGMVFEGTTVEFVE